MAAQTTGCWPRLKKVSAAIAALFCGHSQACQPVSVQAAFHAQFVQALTAGAGSYASAEAANASPLQSLFDAINTPTGRLLIGNGANGAPGTQGKPASPRGGGCSATAGLAGSADSADSAGSTPRAATAEPAGTASKLTAAPAGPGAMWGWSALAGPVAPAARHWAPPVTAALEGTAEKPASYSATGYRRRRRDRRRRRWSQRQPGAYRQRRQRQHHPDARGWRNRRPRRDLAGHKQDQRIAVEESQRDSRATASRLREKLRWEIRRMATDPSTVDLHRSALPRGRRCAKSGTTRLRAAGQNPLRSRPGSADVQLKLPACEQGVQIMSHTESRRNRDNGTAPTPPHRGTPESPSNPINTPCRRRGTAYDAFTSDVAQRPGRS